MGVIPLTAWWGGQRASLYTHVWTVTSPPLAAATKQPIYNCSGKTATGLTTSLARTSVAAGASDSISRSLTYEYAGLGPDETKATRSYVRQSATGNHRPDVRGKGGLPDRRGRQKKRSIDCAGRGRRWCWRLHWSPRPMRDAIARGPHVTIDRADPPSAPRVTAGRPRCASAAPGHACAPMARCPCPCAIHIERSEVYMNMPRYAHSPPDWA